MEIFVIYKINGVIEAKDRQLNPSKYAKLDELAELEKIREEEKKKQKELLEEQKVYQEFYQKYPNLQNLDISPNITREKILTLLYKMHYNAEFKSKKENKYA